MTDFLRRVRCMTSLASAKLSLEPVPKWIRATVEGRFVVDSKRAQLVRQGTDGKPCTYAVPPEDVVGDLPDEARVDVDGFVAVDWDAVDAWYEEAEEVGVHPRDPKMRIDVRASSRHVVVERDGVRLAESHRPVLLFEDVPKLPIRYYLSHDDVDLRLLEPGGKRTQCPYKGEASHHHVWVGDRRIDDLAWTYPTPLREVEPIRGLIAFYNERVDVTVDGERQERPRTPFS